MSRNLASRVEILMLGIRGGWGGGLGDGWGGGWGDGVSKEHPWFWDSDGWKVDVETRHYELNSNPV